MTVLAKHTCLAGLAAATTLAAVPLAAQESSGRDMWFGIGLGYQKPDGGARHAEDGYGAQLLLGWRLARQFNAEVAATFATLEDNDPSADLFEYFRGDDGSGSTSRASLGTDLLWQPLRGWSPLLIAGVGLAYNKGDPDQDSGTDFFFNYGAGLVSAPLGSYGLKLRAEWRQVRDGYAGDPVDQWFLLGINFPLRRSQAPGQARSTPPPAPPPARADAPAAEPAPRAPPEPAPAPPPLPPLAQVDDDGDGIFNAQDRCPATLMGLRVDQYGCAMEGAVATLSGVRFATGSARLDAAATPALVRLLEALEGQPSMRVELRGHTDAVGDAGANQRLSEQRARSVARFLEGEGIESWRLTTTGFGSSRPLADNTTEEGRASNRRVELRVISP